MSYTDTFCLSDLLESYADEERMARVCRCGHAMGAHDEIDTGHPCDVPGCPCARFTEAEIAEDPDAWRDER